MNTEALPKIKQFCLWEISSIVFLSVLFILVLNQCGSVGEKKHVTSVHRSWFCNVWYWIWWQLSGSCSCCQITVNQIWLVEYIYLSCCVIIQMHGTCCDVILHIRGKIIFKRLQGKIYTCLNHHLLSLSVPFCTIFSSHRLEMYFRGVWDNNVFTYNRFNRPGMKMLFE